MVDRNLVEFVIGGELVEEAGSSDIFAAGIKVTAYIENCFWMFNIQLLNTNDKLGKIIYELPFLPCSWKIHTDMDTQWKARWWKHHWKE